MYLTNIPEQLLNLEKAGEDVNIILGENGTGKSYLLAELLKQYSRRHMTVVAIANTIYDKFDSYGPNVHLLRDRSGRRRATQTIKRSLINISDSDISRLSFASRKFWTDVDINQGLVFRFLKLETNSILN